MITYKKKVLKVKTLTTSNMNDRDHGAWQLSMNIQGFIEGGEYSRIVDWKIHGEGHKAVCTIIYEVKK